MMVRTIFSVAALSIAITAAVAQSDPIKTRKDLMDANDKNFRNIRAMVRGEAAYDQGKVTEAFAQFSDTAQKFGALFPEDSKTGQNTRATPKIWETRADFEAKLAAFGRVVNEHRDKVKSLDDLKVALPAIDNACNDCHRDYRARRQN